MRPILTLTLLGSLALTACNGAAGVAYNPNPPPPPVREEVIPKPPVSEIVLIWQPGHWDWDGTGGYFWRTGEYVDRQGHGTQWQDGYWTNASGRWSWIPAHWV